MFDEERNIEAHKYTGWRLHWISVYYYGTRQCIASAAWVANDFAFYGNKLQQGLFLGILYPTVSEDWRHLNSLAPPPSMSPRSRLQHYKRL